MNQKLQNLGSQVCHIPSVFTRNSRRRFCLMLIGLLYIALEHMRWREVCASLLYFIYLHFNDILNSSDYPVSDARVISQ
jgi:hypothetical protein